jgi:hypothetical protein
MVRIPINQAVGLQLRGPVILSNINPSSRMVTVEQGLSASFLTWEQLERVYGIALAPLEEERTLPEEKAKDEESRLEAAGKDLARAS